MKTKVAVVLMFGKEVIGTPEAFTSYVEVPDNAGWVCESAEEFVAAINIASVSITKSFDPALRNILQ
jgi:hypothetical protein